MTSRVNNLTLVDALNGNRNSLGFLRLTFAIMVVISHTYPLGGFGADPLFKHFGAYDSLSGVAVAGFFGLSGFLIARSGLNLDFMQFMWRRILRIFPAYWTSLLLAAFVIGPLIWIHEGNLLGSYFSFANQGPFTYVFANWDLSIGQFGIFDIFTSTTPYGDSTKSSIINGSIWTLIYEWTCYLIIGVMVLFGLFRKSKFLVVAIASTLGIFLLFNTFQPGSVGAAIPYLSDSYTISLGFTFFVSASLGVYADKIKLDDRLAVAAGLVSLLSLLHGGWIFFGFLSFPYFLLWLGAALPKLFQSVGAKNDYSYGMYVYAFMVQQVTAYLGFYKIGAYAWLVMCILITLGISWLSWHLIEKPAMSLKSHGPGRGIQYWTQAIVGKVRKS